jgi:hypothetical protein
MAFGKGWVESGCESHLKGVSDKGIPHIIDLVEVL